VTLAAKLGLAASTVGKVLRRFGCSRAPRAARAEVVRSERERPGELLHVEHQEAGGFWQAGKRVVGEGQGRSRHAGWQSLHVAVDDHSRLAYVELLPSERAEDAVRRADEDFVPPCSLTGGAAAAAPARRGRRLGGDRASQARMSA